MAQASRVTRPSLPKFLPVEDADNALRITSNGSIFRVVSYNILAQVYVKSSLFPHSPPPCLRWKARSLAILQVLKSFEADFLCLQELDEYDSFYEGHMKDHGYSSVYIQRTGQKRDGCGIFYKGSCADLMLKEEIEYNDLVNFVEDGKVLCGKKSYVTLNIKERTDTSAKGLPEDVERDTNVPDIRLKRDCVGLMAAFKLKDPYNHLVIVANTHIYWDPELADIKLAQAKYLLSRLHQFKALVSEKFKCTPSIIITGDFNSTPGDKVYQYLVPGSSPTHQADFYEEQPIPLSSLYASVREEPPFTNCTPGFTGTLDYVLFSAGGVLKPVSFLELPGPGSPDIVGGLPNFHHPSDHLPIGGDFEVNTTSTLEADLKLLHI